MLTCSTLEDVITHLKSICARHDITDIVLSKKGYSINDEFAKDFRFTHITNTTHFPQSNGEAEHPVKTIKQLLKKSSNSDLDLLTYISTPL